MIKREKIQYIADHSNEPVNYLKLLSDPAIENLFEHAIEKANEIALSC